MDNNEIKETLQYFEKDTKRKQILFLNKWIKDINEVIESCESRLKGNLFVWYLGEKKYTLEPEYKELKAVKTYLDNLKAQ